MLKIGVSGYSGRMGRELQDIVSDKAKIISGLVRGVDRDLTHEIRVTENMADFFEGVELVIDFSTPNNCMRVVKECANRGIAIVTGTTGLSVEQFNTLKEASKKIPVFWAANYSLGVNVFAKLSALAASMLGSEYDIEIMEFHHNRKKDSPSGTAIEVGKGIASALNVEFEKVAVFNREGERTKGEIGFSSIRAGDIIGEHRVLLSAHGSNVELKAAEHSRGVYAHGAFRAALWLASKQSPGFYGMDDLLGL